MSRSIFISYDYNDRAWRDKVRSWQQQGLLGSSVVVTHERGDYRPEGEVAIKNEIRSMIQGCTYVLVLVGDNTHNRPWLDYEIEVANSKGKRILLGRIPGTSGAAPLKVRHHTEIPLVPSSLVRHL